MIELRRNLLPPATAAIIDELADETALEGFCLVGGTALALQAGHRRSLDVDLVTFATKLDKNGLFRAMRARGATLVTPQSMISTAKINGIDLLAHVQNYALNGIKVHCFADFAGQRHAQGIQVVKGWRFPSRSLSSPTRFPAHCQPYAATPPPILVRRALLTSGAPPAR
jgi:hypothetical protein